jgi:hypothetical protein
MIKTCGPLPLSFEAFVQWLKAFKTGHKFHGRHALNQVGFTANPATSTPNMSR